MPLSAANGEKMPLAAATMQGPLAELSRIGAPGMHLQAAKHASIAQSPGPTCEGFSPVGPQAKATSGRVPYGSFANPNCK